MFWADRINKLAGVTLLLLVALIIVNIALSTAAVGDADPTKRGELEGILRDINDDRALYFLSVAFSIASDAVVLLAVAAMLYILFRDRSDVLAMCGLALFVGAAATFLVADAAGLTVGILAADFVEKGGAGGIPTGDPAILQSTRAVATMGAAAESLGSTAIGAGLLAFGSLLMWAPTAAVNPPRWVGGLGVVAGLALMLTWIAVADENAGIAVATVGYIGTAVWLAVLGGWLVIQPVSSPALGETLPSAT